MKRRIKAPTNLTIDPKIKKRAVIVAFRRNESLSQLVTKLLKDFCDSVDVNKTVRSA